MRIVKEAEERKNEILDVADKLFFTKGFEATSTNDILQEVGIARGTLYYHFKSKQDIMEALIERYNKQILESAKRVAHNKQMPVYQRIFQVIKSLNISQYSDTSEEVLKHIHNPKNILMHQRIQQMIIVSVTPILADLIKEGIEEGLFQTPVPYECMEMIMIYGTTLFDGDFIELTEEMQSARMQALLFNAERMLGCTPGSLEKSLSHLS